jgi:hypothetical protein
MNVLSQQPYNNGNDPTRVSIFNLTLGTVCFRYKLHQNPCYGC